MNTLFSYLLLLSAFGIAVNALGGVLGRSRSEAPARLGGPYRAPAFELSPRARGSGPRLAAFGSLIVAAVAAPALVAALLTLRWVAIDMALLPCIVLGAVRVAGSASAMRPRDRRGLAALAIASLVLDVPLAAFALLHVSRGDVEVSFGSVAAVFAIADGAQSLFVFSASGA